MQKMVLSIVEKKFIRMIAILALAQVLLILVFVRLFCTGQPTRIQDTEQSVIVVDDMRYNSLYRNSHLLVMADSETYLFDGSGPFCKYADYELSEMISVGDTLSLRSKEDYRFPYGKVNVVVEARDGTEIYRTLEEENRSKQGVTTFIVIVFLIIEAVFIGVVWICFWGNHNTFKSLCRKIKKHRLKQKSKGM